MSFRNAFKKIQRTLARFLFFFSRAVIRILPYPVFRLVSSIFVGLGYIVMAKKKRMAIENLRVAFGETKSDEEIKQIFKQCFRNMGRGMVDLIYFLDRPKKIMEKVSVEGLEHLDEALKKENGAVILSAHFGIFILMYLRIILEGYPTNVIMRRTRDEEFEKSITNLRENLGIKTIYALPQRQCIQDSIKALRKNELLYILLDQNYGSEGGVFVEFFGRKAATAAGPVVFSSRTKAPILPMFIIREMQQQPNGKMKMTDRHKIVIEPPIEIEGVAKDKEAVVRDVAKLSNVIQSMVEKYPHEWGGWMHQRWKSQYKN